MDKLGVVVLVRSVAGIQQGSTKLMANLDFFAAHDDQVAILDFLFSQTDARVFELASDYGQELREFSSIEELESHYSIGTDIYGNALSTLLLLCSPTLSGAPRIRRITLNPRSCEGHTFRYALDGGGLMQLYFGGMHDKHGKIITRSHFGHNSQKRAQAWGVAEGTDWPALAKLSNKIQCHIRQRLAVTRVAGHPVLPQAFKLAQQGYALKESANWPGQYEIPA